MPDFQDYLSLIKASPSPMDALATGMDQARQRSFQIQQMNAQQQQQQAALAAAQVRQAAINKAIANPSADNYRAAALADSEHSAGILGALGTLTTEGRASELKHAAAVDGYLQAGDYDNALKEVQSRREADAAIGKDVSNDDALINLIQTNPKAARAHSGIMMAVAGNPDQFASTLNATDANQRLPGQIAGDAATAAKTAAETSQITNPRPVYEMAPNPMGGSPFVMNKNTGQISGGSATGGGGPTSNNGALEDFDTRLAGSEAPANDPNAKNPNSSATGPGQFIEGTWLDVFPKLHPELVQGKSREQILAYRSNPALAKETRQQYTADNAETLTNAGLPVTGATLAMAYKLGPADAQKVIGVLQTAPQTPLSKVLSPEVIKANPQLKGQTAVGYAKGFMSQFGDTPIDTAPGDPTATGAAFLKTLPPGRARQIEAYADGRLAFPSGFSATRPAGQLLLDQIGQFDPTFDASDFKSRSRTRQDFTSGKAAGQLRSLNQAVGHLGDFAQTINGLGNTGFPANNWAAHGIAGMTGTDQRLIKYRSARKIALDEAAAVLAGAGGGSLADRQALEQLFPENANPETLHQGVQQIVTMFGSKIDALGDQYNKGLGKSEDPLRLLSPHAADTLQKLKGASSSDGQQAPAYAKSPDGKTYVSVDGGKTWNPAS